MLLVCHVISQDHMTEGWSNIMGGSPSWQVTSLPNLVAIGTAVVEMTLICHVILENHALEGWSDFIGWSPSRLSYCPAKFKDMVLVLRVILQDHVIRALWLYEQETMKVN